MKLWANMSKHYLLGLTHVEKGKWPETFSNQMQNISHKKKFLSHFWLLRESYKTLSNAEFKNQKP